MQRFRSYNSYMKSLFGEKVYKLSLDGGMTCPNRDGTVGFGGCTFCIGGSGDFAEFGDDISTQIENAKRRVASKFSGSKYIAYFQSYTNTYAPLSRLKALFDPVIMRDDIVGLSIGTRPDCLPDDVIEYLAELNKVKHIWIELGLQTIHEKTAEAFNRGYPLSAYDDAAKRLKNAGIDTVVHVIFGLPGETREMMLDTVRYIAESGVSGIKLQLLHILDGTKMAEEYAETHFKILELDEYIDLLEEAIELLPTDIVVHRITGDGAKRRLIAPLWSGDKKHVLNTINSRFEQDDVVQGKHYIK